MSVFTIMRLEWRRMWRNKLVRAGLAAGLVLPLLYSSLYLWAFWDPYGHLNKLPVAIVNMDTGGTLDHKAVNYGKNITNSLVDAKDLDWHVVSNQDAMAGLKDDKYYMVLRIPTSFSSDILSVNSGKPHKADLEFIPNQGRNYLAGQIVQHVQSDVATSISQEFSQQFTQRLLDVVDQEQGSFGKVASTAKQLADGGQNLKTGSTSLMNGLQGANTGALQLAQALTKMVPGSASLASGLAQVQAGTSQVATGIGQASNGISSVRQQIAPAAGPASQLAQGMKQAASGAAQMQQSSQQLEDSVSQAQSSASDLSSGLSQSQTGAQQLQSGINQANGLLQQYEQSAGPGADPRVTQAFQILGQLTPGAGTLVSGLSQSQAGVSTLADSLGQIHNGQQQLTSGLSSLVTQLNQASTSTQQFAGSVGQLDGGLANIQNGLNQAQSSLGQLGHAEGQLQQGASQLNSGLRQSAQGAGQLSSGISNASNGSQKLNQGMTKLSDGLNTFSGKLSDAKQSGSQANTGVLAKVMSNPVQETTQVLNPVSQYGTGLAPYFVPLSLWVGALMLFFLMPLRESRWRIAPVSNISVTMGKFGVLWIIAAVQAVVAASVLRYALGLTVQYPLGFYGFAIVLSITYVTVIGMFIGILGSGPGRVIGIALLLLQLTSCGGTFPVELIPQFFQEIHPILPMSYAVTGLRDIISIGDASGGWNMVLVNLAYLVGALALICAWSLRPVHLKELKVADQLVS